MAPIIAGNLFSLIFGRNLDKNEHASQNAPAHSPVQRSDSEGGGPPHCLRGQACYVDTIYITMFATFVAILLSLYAGYRDRQKLLAVGTRRPRSTSSRLIDEEPDAA